MLTGPEEMHEQQFAVKKEKEFNSELAHQEYRELILRWHAGYRLPRAKSQGAGVRGSGLFWELIGHR